MANITTWPFAERRVHDLRAVGEGLAADEHARQQHLVGIRGEAQDDARRLGACTRAERCSAATSLP